MRSWLRVSSAGGAAPRVSSGSMPSGTTGVRSAAVPAPRRVCLTASETAQIRYGLLAAAPFAAGVYLQYSHSPSLRRDFHDSGENAAQGVELEGLLEERTAQLFEELQGVAAHRVAGGEDDAIGDRRMHARERLKHLATAQPGHPQVADDEIEGLHERPFQRLAAVVRDHYL